jgi:hypothetical protein
VEDGELVKELSNVFLVLAPPPSPRRPADLVYVRAVGNSAPHIEIGDVWRVGNPSNSSLSQDRCSSIQILHGSVLLIVPIMQFQFPADSTKLDDEE